jgi:hypothetical protein
MLHKDYARKGSVENNSMVVSLKGLDAKTNLLAVNRQSQSNFDFDFGYERVLRRQLEE